MLFNSLKANLALCLGLFTLVATSVHGQQSTSVEFDQQRTPPNFSKDMPIDVSMQKTERSLTTSGYQLFSIQFATWVPDHLHWDAPSNMNIHSDGAYFIYSKHLANMRRTGGFFDTGNRYNTLVNVTYFDGPLNGQNQCTGTVLHSRDYHLRGLDYKDEAWDVTANGMDNRIAEIAARVKCGSFTRWWR